MKYEFKGTQGEWHLTKDEAPKKCTIGTHKHVVSEVNNLWYNGMYQHNEKNANAKLIAAAPELFECLKAYVADDVTGSLKNQNAIAVLEKICNDK